MVERFKEAFYIDAFRFVTKPFEMEEIRAIGGEVELFIKGKKYRKDITLTDLERELSETLIFSNQQAVHSESGGDYGAESQYG